MTVFADQVEAVYGAVEALDGRSPALGQERERESACDEMRALE